VQRNFAAKERVNRHEPLSSPSGAQSVKLGNDVPLPLAADRGGATTYQPASM
jgi:hypothetical protein